MRRLGWAVFYAWGIGMILLATVGIVREMRSAEHERCYAERDVGPNGVYISDVECPPDDP